MFQTKLLASMWAMTKDNLAVRSGSRRELMTNLCICFEEYYHGLWAEEVGHRTSRLVMPCIIYYATWARLEG